MPDASFVEEIEIASDDRLASLRPPDTVMLEDRRRGDREVVPEAIGGNLRAAVNAGTIVSFVAGLTPEEMSDVLYSTQFAHRAASAKHDRFTATDDWYRTYADILTRLGWVGETFAFEQRKNTAGSFMMDKAALDVILTIATGNQLAILVRAIDTLKTLAEDDQAIRVFEYQTLSALSGNFQIGAVQRAENKALSLAIGGFHFRSREAKRRTLFIRWGTEEVTFWTGATKLTLNSHHYGQHRAAVAKRLATDAASYIAAIEIT
jgi:hypothetical protein